MEISPMSLVNPLHIGGARGLCTGIQSKKKIPEKSKYFPEVNSGKQVAFSVPSR